MYSKNLIGPPISGLALSVLYFHDASKKKLVVIGDCTPAAYSALVCVDFA